MSRKRVELGIRFGRFQSRDGADLVGLRAAQRRLLARADRLRGRRSFQQRAAGGRVSAFARHAQEKQSLRRNGIHRQQSFQTINSG